MWKMWTMGLLVLCQIMIAPGAAWAQDNSIKLYELTVSPMPQDREALKYRFMPRVFELKNANAVVLYQQAAAMYPEDKDINIKELIDTWRTVDIKDFPCDEVSDMLNRFKNSFRLIELASIRDHCTWDMPIEEGFAMVLPSLATFRQLTFAMGVKVRVHMLNGQIDESLSTIRQGLTMGRGIAEGPTLIQDLVGIAIAAAMLNHTGELIGTPDAPNLYWALTELPRPFVDLRQSMSYEYDLMYWEIPELSDLAKNVLSQEQASDLVNKTFRKFAEAGFSDMAGFELLPMAWVMMHYVDAKAFLSERGMDISRIEAMPAAQAVMLYQFKEFEEVKDNMFKWLTLPFDQYRTYAKEYDQAMNQVMDRGFKTNLFTQYLPALSRVKFLEARMCRDVDLLRVIEALRMHAAENNGQFPKTLDDVMIVPVPNDPVTGGPFIYKYKDSRHVRVEAPEAEEQRNKRPVYELTLRP